MKPGSKSRFENKCATSASRDLRRLTTLVQRRGAFTLIELLVVMGLIAAISFFMIGAMGNGGNAASLKSAQAMLANWITLARTEAMANGQSCRLLINIDPTSANEPRRYLHYGVVQLQTPDGWQTITDGFLPDKIYVVPGLFPTIPAGLYSAAGAVPWTKVDGSDLRSTALRSNQISLEAINGSLVEQWVSIVLSNNAGTLQSGDVVLVAGHPRSAGSFVEGESPVELENPANVRGATLSAYGVPTLINTRTSF